MPGGSVNGRPFRESPDAYSRTGIPCGNPRRFQSRDVVKMGVGKQSALSRPLTGPLEQMETEGERHLQCLLQKQLCTDTTVEEHFKQRKSFTDGVVHQSPVDKLSGAVPLTQYKHLSEVDDYVLGLKHCGLTAEEIELKLENTGMASTKAKKLRLNLEPGIREQKLEAINRKIEEKEKELDISDRFSGAKAMGRHEMDLENAISQNSDRSKQLSCLLTTRPSSRSQPDDPMGHLPEILTQMTKRAKEDRVNKKRSKPGGQYTCANKDQASLGIVEGREEAFVSTCISNEPLIGPQPEPESVLTPTFVPGSDGQKKQNLSCEVNRTDSNSNNQPESEASGEVKAALNANVRLRHKGHRTSSAPCKGQESSQNVENRTRLCQRDDLSHSADSKTGDKQSSVALQEEHPRWLFGRIEAIPEQEIKGNRLSLEQVRELPRFRDYSPGEPSKVLYLKNLPGKVREEDLVALFIRYQRDDGPRIIFKLMTGRMRGQAFVTLDSEDTASEALHLINGYVFQGRPLIIQFGKGRPAS